MSSTYSIVIPAFNEARRLGETLDRVSGFVVQQGWNAEVVVVNDGSTDNTADLVRQHALRNPVIRLIENPGNRGKGYSVRNGMLSGRGEVLLFTDADLSAPIEEAEKLLTAIRGGADIAIGSRWLVPSLQTQRQTLLRQFLGRGYNVLMRIILGLNFKDTQCGFKAFTRAAAQQIFPAQHVERWGFDPELIFLARRARLRVAEVPVRWGHDSGTRLHPVRDSFHMFLDLLTIRWNDICGRYRLGAPAETEYSPQVAERAASDGAAVGKGK